MATDLLENYNALRKRKGMPPFQKWTGTQEALQEAYNKLNGSTSNGEPPKETESKRKAAEGKVAKVKRTEKKPPPVESKEKVADKKPPEPEGVPLADICEDLKLEPRAARMKLRALSKEKDSKLPKPVGNLWAWDEKDVAKVKALLSAEDKAEAPRKKK